MASPETMDVAALLAPIEGDSPTGVDLREDDSPVSIYARLTTLRAEASAFERARDMAPPEDDSSGTSAPVAPAWTQIADLCEQALREKTKDLQVACWLAEARLRLDRFAGLRDALAVAAGLVRNFWDNLYSFKDEDDPTAKGSPVTSLNGEDRDGPLVMALRNTALTMPVPPGPFSFWQAEELHKKNQLDQVMSVVRQGPRDFYVATVEDIAACRTHFTDLADQMRERMERDGPSTSRIAELLESIEEMARRITGIGAGGAAAPAAGAAAAAGGAAGTVAMPIGPGGFSTREQALEAILAAAQFFEQREPQAPIGMTLREAVRRARMSLDELLTELLPDEAARRLLLMNAGIKPRGDGEAAPE